MTSKEQAEMSGAKPEKVTVEISSCSVIRTRETN
jgi:hypothetical protein